MSNFAILRTQKLKSRTAVRRSLSHAFRSQDTPNADPSRAATNTHIGAVNVDEALAKFDQAMPAKVRSNGVVCIEYLVTASPDSMHSKTKQQQDLYFRDAIRWLAKRHGSANLLYAGIHRDETTPHLYCYVVPKDERGRLNCRAFLGGAQALSEMQTDFAAKVGAPHGLERGQPRSKAKHTTVRQWYAQIEPQAQQNAKMKAHLDSVAEQLSEAREAVLAGRRQLRERVEAMEQERTRLRQLAEALTTEQQSDAAKRLDDIKKRDLDRRADSPQSSPQELSDAPARRSPRLR
jgi:hypothetical protein